MNEIVKALLVGAMLLCITDAASAQNAAVSISQPNVGAGTIGATVQYTTGSDWYQVIKVVLFAAKNGENLVKAESSTGQLAIVISGVTTGEYSVWANVLYKKRVDKMVGGMTTPTPSEETYIMFSDSKTATVANAWNGNANQAQPSPHGTATVLNDVNGGTITSLGNVGTLQDGWKVSSVEMYIVPQQGGTAIIKKQDYNPATAATPVNWNLTQSSVPAGTYKVYIVITLVKNSESQQLILGPTSKTIN